MIYLDAAFAQHFAPAELAGAVRGALGKPLRRAAPLTQLALVGALTALPAASRKLPTALLWQSTSGPRRETLNLLDEMCTGGGEPMPYDFLATQPAVAAAQIQPFLPGLQSATHVPLDDEKLAHWALLLALASQWLNEGRYARVLCAALDTWDEVATGRWLCVGAQPLENSLASLQLTDNPPPASLPDTTDFPAQLADWLAGDSNSPLALHSPAASRLTLEFSRL
jgi:hypothetical protein